MKKNKEYSQVFSLILTVWKSPKVPKWAKILSVIFIILVISPIDFIPDVIPVIGLVDDISMIVWIIVYFWSKLRKKDTKSIDNAKNL